MTRDNRLPFTMGCMPHSTLQMDVHIDYESVINVVAMNATPDPIEVSVSQPGELVRLYDDNRKLARVARASRELQLALDEALGEATRESIRVPIASERALAAAEELDRAMNDAAAAIERAK